MSKKQLKINDIGMNSEKLSSVAVGDLMPLPGDFDDGEWSEIPEAIKEEEKPRQNGLLETDHAMRGFHLDVQLNPDQVVQAAEILDSEGLSIEAVTGVDWLADGQFEVVYDYAYTAGGPLFRVVVRARVDREQPDIPTVSEIYGGANWHERETWDLFGINFVGHPQLERFLLPDDCDYHPLRKDFKP